MSTSLARGTSPVRVSAYILVLSLAWSLIVTASLVWNIFHIKKATLEMTRIQARASFQKDVLYRRWNAGHGGVYVPVSLGTQPNPYLTVPHRDVVVSQDKKLTLINPAFMTRQVHEIALKGTGVKGHITSLNPIRPANAADPWESQALAQFNQGEKEVSAVQEMNGILYLRLMRPLVTEKGCLKCHEAQGYKVGDIRGGISISVPISPMLEIERAQMLTLSLGHGLLWLSGLIGLFYGLGRLNRRVTSEHRTAQKALIDSESKYRQIYENAVEGMYRTSPSGNFVAVNPAMAAILGYDSPDDLIQSVKDIGTQLYVNAQDREIFLGQVEKSGRIHGFEVEFYKKNQDRIWVESNARAVKDSTGNLIAIEGFITDISQRRQMETALRTARDDLEVRVSDRTRDLEEKTAKLERMNRLFIDRELRIKELKAKLDQLTGSDPE